MWKIRTAPACNWHSGERRSVRPKAIGIELPSVWRPDAASTVLNAAQHGGSRSYEFNAQCRIPLDRLLRSIDRVVMLSLPCMEVSNRAS